MPKQTHIYVQFSSPGYFLYDTIDMVYNKKLLEYWEVTLHHIFVSIDY